MRQRTSYGPSAAAKVFPCAYKSLWLEMGRELIYIKPDYSAEGIFKEFLKNPNHDYLAAFKNHYSNQVACNKAVCVF